MVVGDDAPGHAYINPTFGDLFLMTWAKMMHHHHPGCRRQALVSWVLFEGALVGSVTRRVLKKVYM